MADASKSGTVWIGTSGWNYKHWSGIFYPAELRQKDWFSHYARHFATVELNNTFYRLPKKETFEQWREKAPPGFLYAVKGNRFITHIKKLTAPEESLRPFVENVVALGDKLGPVLFQFPPGWKWHRERVEPFLQVLRTDARTKDWRISFEIRNASWYTEEAFELLRRFEVALCFADWPDLKVDKPLTSSDFVYVRRHGPGALYASGYTDEQIRRDARDIVRWCDEGLDVFVYYNNDAGGWAVRDAKALMEAVESLGCATVQRPGQK